MASHPDDICPGFDDARCHHRRPRDRHDLHRNPSGRIDLAQFVDHRIEVFDAVDILVVEGGLQLRANVDVAHLGDNGHDLASGEKAAHTGFRALCDLDLDHPAVAQVRWRDAEASGGELVTLRIGLLTAGQSLHAIGREPPFAGANGAAHEIVGDGHITMGGVTDRAKRHVAAEHPPLTVEVYEDLPF